MLAKRRNKVQTEYTDMAQRQARKEKRKIQTHQHPIPTRAGNPLAKTKTENKTFPGTNKDPLGKLNVSLNNYAKY